MAVTLGIYLQTLAFDFVWDDGQYIIDNFKIQTWSWQNFLRLWSQPHLFNYAPLHVQLLAAIHALCELNPFGYHLVQLLLHALCVGLVYHLIARLESPRVALLASLWFAVYAPNVETVAWVSETKSTLSFALFLLSFLFYMRSRERSALGSSMDAALSALFLVLSLLAKVSTVVAPAVFLAYELREDSRLTRAKLRGLLPAAMIAVAFVIIHLYISQPMQSTAAERLRDAALLSGESPAGGGRYFGGFATHLLNAPGLLLHYAQNALVPHGMSPWRMVSVETALSLRAVLAWLVALALLAGLIALPRRTRFWGLWFLLFLAPVLQLVPNATWVTDRYLYIPAIGVFVLMSELLCRLLDRAASGGMAPMWQGAWQGAAVLALAALGWQSLGYVRTWTDDVALWRAAQPLCERSAFCHYKLGDAEMEAGTGTPVAHLERAAALGRERNFAFALARAYTDVAGDFARANNVYQRVQREGAPLPLAAVSAIARNYYLAGNDERAANAIRAGLSINPRHSGLIITRAFLEWRQGNAPAARLSLRDALAINRDNPEAQHPPRFLLEFWQRPAEVGALLRAVGPL